MDANLTTWIWSWNSHKDGRWQLTPQNFPLTSTYALWHDSSSHKWNKNVTDKNIVKETHKAQTIDNSKLSIWSQRLVCTKFTQYFLVNQIFQCMPVSPALRRHYIVNPVSQNTRNAKPKLNLASLHCITTLTKDSPFLLQNTIKRVHSTP